MKDINELIHVGVKGMRWGKKKNPKAIDWEKVSKLKKKKVSELSDEELTMLNRRMNLEKNFKQLNPSKVKKGQMAADSVISGIGKFTAAATGIAAAIALGKKIFDKIQPIAR